MADDDLFLDDDKPKREQKGAGNAPAPGFDAFADVSVEAGIGKLEASGDADAAKSDRKSKAKGKRKKPTVPAVGVDGPSPSPQPGEKAEILPERATDLWPCPHCGAKNKPERDSCRNCGKTVDDEVEIPLQYRPWFKPAVAGAVVVFILLIFTYACSMM